MARPRRPSLSPRLAEYRCGRNLTQEQVAEAIGITPEMVRRHEKGLAHPVERYRRRYSAFYRASQASLGLVRPAPGGKPSPVVNVTELVAEITESGASNEAIELLDHGTTTLAQLHTSAPARHVLRQVLQLRANAHALVTGPIRLSQARELYRIESELEVTPAGRTPPDLAVAEEEDARWGVEASTPRSSGATPRSSHSTVAGRSGT